MPPRHTVHQNHRHQFAKLLEQLRIRIDIHADPPLATRRGHLIEYAMRVVAQMAALTLHQEQSDIARPRAGGGRGSGGQSGPHVSIHSATVVATARRPPTRHRDARTWRVSWQ